MVFVATFQATAAYRLNGRRLGSCGGTGTGGTSPVVAGGLSTSTTPAAAEVYVPGTGQRPPRCRPRRSLAEPDVAAGRVYLSGGNANDWRGSASWTSTACPQAARRRRTWGPAGRVRRRPARSATRSASVARARRGQVLAGVEPPVERVHLGGQPVEPLEQRVELPIADLLPFHAGIVRAGRRRDRQEW